LTFVNSNTKKYTKMGKGDKKTRRGKLFQGSFGVRRRKKASEKKVISVVSVNKAEEVKTSKVAKEKVHETKPVVKADVEIESAKENAIAPKPEVSVTVSEGKPSKPAKEGAKKPATEGKTKPASAKKPAKPKQQD
jgi:30S ribosomal protein S31